MKNKKVCEGRQWNNTEVVIYRLTSIIQGQIKEGKSLRLNCAVLQDIADILSSESRVIFASAEQASNNDFKTILNNHF